MGNVKVYHAEFFCHVYQKINNKVLDLVTMFLCSKGSKMALHFNF